MRPWIRLALPLLLATALPAQAQSSGDIDLTPRAPMPLVQIAPGEVPVRVAAAQVLVEQGAGLVRTRIDLHLHNPGRRLLEGHLQFPLHPGQQVVGFALDIDGELREAVPVDKTRGREVFEAIERREIDPGLLEQTEGDFFRLRVYPFPPGGSRHVRIELVQPLVRTGRTLSASLPLDFAAGLDRIALEVRAAHAPRTSGLARSEPRWRRTGDRYRTTLTARMFDPARGLDLHFQRADGPRVQRQDHGDATWVLAEVPVHGGDAPRVLPARIGLLWDSSMSGAGRAHDLEFALLDAYFRAAGDVEVKLTRLRNEPAPTERYFVRGGDWRGLRMALEGTEYDGATQAGGWTPEPGLGEYLLFSDGLFNFGPHAFPEFADGQRLFTVMAGRAGDSARLAALAHARNGEAISLRDAGDLAGASHALLHEAPRLLALEGTGVRELVAESPVARDGTLRVAGRLHAPDARIRLRVLVGAREETFEVPLADAREGGLAAAQWARFSLAALRAEPERNRAAISALGKRFGIVTPETSLLVLEEVADYVRYDIPPPPALRDQFDRLRASGLAERAGNRRSRVDRVADAWAARIAWWETDFQSRPAQASSMHDDLAPAGLPPRAQPDSPLAMSAPLPPPPPPTPPEIRAVDARGMQSITVTGSRSQGSAEASGADSPGAAATITLAPWQPDAAYARRMRLASPRATYAIYLDERKRHPPSTAFFLDAADILMARGHEGLALRVLSNLAELDLENRHVLRVLGYRLIQAGRADLAVPVFERVLGMGAEEPQSYRDLALALAATGERQRAIDLLHEVVVGEWDGRFPDIEMTALAELNALVATATEPLDTSAIDPRLLRNLPLDLRVVLAWDSDNSDMDLWVTDPNGEKAFYGNRLTEQGGRMSNDFTGGYGPEEFALRRALPGTYRVEANFFGDRQQIITGPTTLMLWLSTGFGTAAQRDQRVTLRLAERSETVLVGEFSVAPLD